MHTYFQAQLNGYNNISWLLKNPLQFVDVHHEDLHTYKHTYTAWWHHNENLPVVHTELALDLK